MLQAPSIIDTSTNPERMISLAEVSKKSESLARYLLSRGLPYQSRVALLGPNSSSYFIALLAIRKAGHIAVPLNSHAPPAWIERALRDCGVSLAFCADSLTLSLPEGASRLSLDRLEDLLRGHETGELPVFPGARLALVIFTSGSTGLQKGVTLTEQARRDFVIANIVQQRMIRRNSDSNGITLIATPLTHILANNMAESTYGLGESFVLMPKFEPRAFVEAIRKFKVTRVSMVPSMWSMIEREVPDLASFDLSSVRHVYFSSEPLQERHLKGAEQAFPKAFLENCYGISEVGPNLFGPHPQGMARPKLSVGYPRSGIQYRLVKGELEIKSPFMLSGYLDRPDLTTAALTADGYYRTRDLFSVDANGFYFFQGRNDDLIISGGKNIYPREIERVLASHEAVAECAVISLADEIKGEKAYAFVVRKPGFQVAEQELRDHVARSAAATLVPRRIWFLERLPMTESLKVDQRNLKLLAEKNLRGG